MVENANVPLQGPYLKKGVEKGLWDPVWQKPRDNSFTKITTVDKLFQTDCSAVREFLRNCRCRMWPSQRTVRRKMQTKKGLKLQENLSR